MPDVPEEFFRLPYPEVGSPNPVPAVPATVLAPRESVGCQARADSIRWGAIYHNGGVFLEPDVLMAGDISTILEKLVP